MLVQELTYGKKYAAVEHAENKQFHFLQLIKEKNEFDISKKHQATSFEKLMAEIKGQKHLFLVINDENVLSKKIVATNSNPASVVKTAFPNIIINDFYYEVYSNQETSYIAISRKETIGEIISQYQKEGISIVDFSLGNLAIKNLISFVNNKTIHSSNAIIEFEENGVSNIKKESTSNEIFTINDLRISNNELLSLSGIIGYYSKNTSSQIQEKLKDNYLQKRFFDIGLKAALGFLLSILLVNFLFFSSYREKVGNLTGELQLSETYKNQLNVLQKDVTQKKRLVKSVNSASNSQLSKYIDDLGFSVPKTILLTQINYQPINGIIRADKKLFFDEDKIVVKGNSKVDENFSDWISILEKKDWVQYISILGYGKGKKTNTIANFEFIIKIDER